MSKKARFSVNPESFGMPIINTTHRWVGFEALIIKLFDNANDGIPLRWRDICDAVGCA
jgi:hypothetical protein